jgi:hypothetical protein
MDRMENPWHTLVRELVMNISITQRIAIQSAQLLRSDMSPPEEKWWFDMEYVDNVIKSREKDNDQK